MIFLIFAADTQKCNKGGIKKASSFPRFQGRSLMNATGSVLGPLLFLAFINDLPSRVKSRTGMFADDCLLYRTIEGQADAHALQKDLDSLQDWEKEWQMAFNADKCEII